MATEINKPLPRWEWTQAPGFYEGYHYWVELARPGELEVYLVTDEPGIVIPWYTTRDAEHTIRVQGWGANWEHKGPWSEVSDPVVNLYVQPVPEPGGVLLIAGLVLLGVMAWWRDR